LCLPAGLHFESASDETARGAPEAGAGLRTAAGQLRDAVGEADRSASFSTEPLTRGLHTTRDAGRTREALILSPRRGHARHAATISGSSVAPSTTRCRCGAGRRRRTANRASPPGAVRSVTRSSSRARSSSSSGAGKRAPLTASVSACSVSSYWRSWRTSVRPAFARQLAGLDRRRASGSRAGPSLWMLSRPSGRADTPAPASAPTWPTSELSARPIVSDSASRTYHSHSRNSLPRKSRSPRPAPIPAPSATRPAIHTAVRSRHPPAARSARAVCQPATLAGPPPVPRSSGRTCAGTGYEPINCLSPPWSRRAARSTGRPKIGYALRRRKRRRALLLQPLAGVLAGLALLAGAGQAAWVPAAIPSSSTCTYARRQVGGHF